MGTTIHHKANGKELCPIKVLAYCIHHILSNGGDDNNLICNYYENNTCYSLQSQQIINMVQMASTSLNLHKQGIDPDLIGAHSLQAGGAMALKLHGYSDTTIMKWDAGLP